MNTQKTNKCIAICGDSASGKTVFAKELTRRFREVLVLECDRYHKWERNDPQWLEYTQLNPSCNDLDLLYQDVQDLKNGRHIIRHSYDHKTGTFTEPTLIYPAEYIIVCGLHTLMCPEGLYDLKIFLNPDPDLKRDWKIARDIRDRGYTCEQVLKQIERRKEDYEKFIQPLMHRADIVLNISKNNYDSILDFLWKNNS